MTKRKTTIVAPELDDDDTPAWIKDNTSDRLTPYTEEELDAMIDFYSSKVGQSIVKKSLPVVKELRKANMLWGMQISASVSSEKARIAAGKDK